MVIITWGLTCDYLAMNFNKGVVKTVDNFWREVLIFIPTEQKLIK
jgi:hypothetical protein